MFPTTQSEIIVDMGLLNVFCLLEKDQELFSITRILRNFEEFARIHHLVIRILKPYNRLNFSVKNSCEIKNILNKIIEIIL